MPEDVRLPDDVESLAAFLREEGVPAGARILDVPCGIGRRALGLARVGYRVTAVDANSGAPVAPNVSGIPVTVQTAAVLVATLSSVTPGPTVTMELELANSGGAPARVSAVTPTASDSTVTCDGASPAPPRTIDGAGASGTPSQRFSWTCTGSGVTATLGATVAASDANTGLDISPTVAGVVVIFAG